MQGRGASVHPLHETKKINPLSKLSHFALLLDRITVPGLDTETLLDKGIFGW